MNASANEIKWSKELTKTFRPNRTVFIGYCDRGTFYIAFSSSIGYAYSLEFASRADGCEQNQKQFVGVYETAAGAKRRAAMFGAPRNQRGKFA